MPEQGVERSRGPAFLERIEYAFVHLILERTVKFHGKF